MRSQCWVTLEAVSTMKSLIFVGLTGAAALTAWVAGEWLPASPDSEQAVQPATWAAAGLSQTPGSTRRRAPCTIQVKEGSPEVTLPAVLPGPKPDVVISNPGVLVAVSRFYALLQSKELKAGDVTRPPFSLDGRTMLKDEKEIQSFIDKVRDTSLKEGRTNTIVQATLLPHGNTWEEAQRWLAPAVAGQRSKALFDHASQHNGWLVLVLIARSKGDKHVYEHTLIAVTNAESEQTARVIGFMD